MDFLNKCPRDVDENSEIVTFVTFVWGAYGFKSTEYNICKNIFACLFSVCNTISLSRQEQACLIGILLFNHQQLCYQQVCLIMTIIV